MMLRRYILALAALMILVSCEEVIEIDLNTAHPALVVEGFLYKDSVATLHLTKTANYFSLDEPVPIEDAIVTLTADGVDSEQLVYVGEGNYQGSSLVGTERVMYDLDITWGENEYTGSTYLPEQPKIVTLDLVEFQPAPEAPTFMQVSTTFLDNPNRIDYYYIKYIQNDTVLQDVYFPFPDETAVQDTIEFTNPLYSFLPGDVIEIELYAIDEALFKYFSQLNDALGGSMAMSSTPYNPTSNIEGAMGYFAAWSYDAATVMVPLPPGF